MKEEEKIQLNEIDGAIFTRESLDELSNGKGDDEDE